MGISAFDAALWLWRSASMAGSVQGIRPGTGGRTEATRLVAACGDRDLVSLIVQGPIKELKSDGTDTGITTHSRQTPAIVFLRTR